MTDAIIFAAVRECTSKEELDQVFAALGVTNREVQYAAIMSAMGDPVFLIGGVLACHYPVDTRLEFAIEHFIAGNWRYKSEVS